MAKPNYSDSSLFHPLDFSVAHRLIIGEHARPLRRATGGLAALAVDPITH
jgi:hypothetical protein